MPVRVDLQREDDLRDVVHHVVQKLTEGCLVAIPTETLYLVAAHGLRGEAVARLANLTPGGEPRSLALKNSEEALDYVPGISRMGKKMIRRCWPGPVRLEFVEGWKNGLIRAFPEMTQKVVTSTGTLTLSVLAHEFLGQILRLLPAPMVLTSERGITGQPETTPENLLSHPEIEMILDDGPCRYAQPPTRIQIDRDQWSLGSEGVVSERTIRRLASDVFLFVCTGNTCRSPMAEGIFRKLMAEKFQCPEDQLIEAGFVATSAGLAASLGAPPSPEAVEVLSVREIDLRAHESQPLTPRLLLQADSIFTMTRGHREAILREYPDMADRVQLLSRDGSDVADPIGGTIDQYQACADEIERYLRAIVTEIPQGKTQAP